MKLCVNIHTPCTLYVAMPRRASVRAQSPLWRLQGNDRRFSKFRSCVWAPQAKCLDRPAYVLASSRPIHPAWM